MPVDRDIVSAVEFVGTDAIAAEELSARIATRSTPKFLGLFRGFFFGYEVLNPYVLAVDLERIERHYRARGFYAASVQAARVVREPSQEVRISIQVHEGAQVRVRELSVVGLEALAARDQTAIRAALEGHMQVGDPFEEARYQAGQASLTRALTDRGYARARVERAAQVDVPREAATLQYRVLPGTRAVFGELQYLGLGNIPRAPVARAIGIDPGQPFSTTALDRARQAALELGVFGSLRLEPLLEKADPNVVPIAVTAQSAPVHMLRLGAGVRLDSVRADVHALASWENRNFLGGLRRLSFEIVPSLVLFGTHLPELSLPRRLLPQIDARASFRQPGLFERRTTGLLWVDYDVRAVLARNAERSQTVLGYRQAVAGVGIDRSFGSHFYLRPSQNLQADTPFSYDGPLDPGLNRRLQMTYLELLGNLDLRDQPVRPRQGLYLSAQPQLAGPLGDARDVRLLQELRGYVPLAARATLALRANVGLLFPFSYGEPDPAEARAKRVRDAQLVYFRGFFSGGSNSNRGYPARGVGPHEVIEFFYPGRSIVSEECTAASVDERCKLPVGGVTLWELSAELRMDLSGPLSLNVFCDTSDVSPSRVDFRLDRPHLSCGPGFRYDTPLGPLRADVGMRIPGLQVLEAGVGVEGSPPTLFGLPIAIALGIGEAF